ncbi:MAG: hypothetical protein JWN46_3543 [Acidimicrobiales bacterium]|nr:hypothetical protein [Acidimicrobiales bacterium]
MTDPDEPLTDEQLSADLDDEADPGVRERIASDPRAKARQEQLREAARLIAAPVDSPAPATIAALVSRALDELAGDDGAGEGDEPPLAPPIPLRRRRLPPPWTVAAAVVVLVVVGLSLVWSGRTSQRHAAQQTAASGSSAADAAKAPSPTTGGHAPSVAGGADPAVSGTPLSRTATAAAAAVDLGTFTDTTALRNALRSGFPSAPPPAARADAAAVSPTALTRCAQVVANTGLPIDALLHTGIARVAGQPLIVYEYQYRPAGPSTTAGKTVAARTLVVAVDPTACKPRLTFVRA